MNWYKINDDKTTEQLPEGTYPSYADCTDENRRVGDDTVNDFRVSTVFLQLDHNWDPDGQPLLFETMIFGGKYDNDMWRYTTWNEAKAGHERIVNCLKEGINPNL
jgi:hypothetical protein